VRKLWWLLVIAAVLVGLVALLAYAPQWAAAALGGAGAAVATAWAFIQGRGGKSPKAQPVDVESTEPARLAREAAESELAKLEAFARAETDEAHAAVDSYREELLGKDPDALAAEAAASPAYAGVRPCPRPMPGHGADPSG